MFPYGHRLEMSIRVGVEWILANLSGVYSSQMDTQLNQSNL